MVTLPNDSVRGEACKNEETNRIKIPKLGYGAHIQLLLLWQSVATVSMKKFDVRKVRKLSARERYGELYFWFREAEQMIASGYPQARRYGRRLKKRVESLHSEWFGAMTPDAYLMGRAGLAF